MLGGGGADGGNSFLVGNNALYIVNLVVKNQGFKYRLRSWPHCGFVTLLVDIRTNRRQMWLMQS